MYWIKSLMINLKEALKNVYFRYFVSFCVGCIVCIIFFPSKTIIKKVEVTNESFKKTIEDLEKQVVTLEKSNYELNKNKRTIIIENSDGSKRTEIEEKTNSKKEISKETIENIKRELKEAKKEIKRLKEYSKLDINKKSFGIEFGVNLNKSYYGHISYDIFNSIFLGTHVEIGKTNNIGIGVGLRL